MTGQDGWSRRAVAKGLAAAAAATIVPRRVLGRGVKAPSDTLAIAAIGAGGRGVDDLKGLEHERIVALCDVDWKRAKNEFSPLLRRQAVQGLPPDARRARRASRRCWSPRPITPTR